MNKKTIIGIVIGIGVIVTLFLLSSLGSPQQTDSSTENENKQVAPAEKIEVVHFHTTQQCWSCITVGKLALKTIEEKFPKEYADGTIIFRDVNGELPENTEIVMKYQARGSSLFINAITSGADSITEDILVWRLVGNEQQFMTYFENKLRKLLRGS